MGDGLPSVEETQIAGELRGESEAQGSSDDDPAHVADGLAGRGVKMGAIDAERLRSAVASRLFGVEAEPVKIGRFTVLKRLGAGGMGVVYSAYDDQLDRKLAIKLLKGEANEQRRARLMREAQALARVSHPNVIHVYEVDTFRGQIYLAMEFVRGRPLDQVHRTPDGDASMAQVLDWFRQAGEGLAGAHEAGLIHRDFKPENCLVGDDGRVRVLDFGLARASGLEAEHGDLDDEERRQLSSSSADSVGSSLRSGTLGSSSGSINDALTRTGAIMGTPAYMAPEQHLGAKVDERSDQFSYCVSLWEKLYGARPFPGESLAALALAVTRGKVNEVPPGKGVPKWIHRVLLRGLAVDPSDRWPDMRSLLAALSAEKRSRKQIIAGVGALAAIALASFAYSATQTRVGPCEASASELSGVWDDAVRSRVREAFMATEATYAQDTFAGTAASLDTYTQRWVHLHRQACIARQVDKVDSPELYGRKMMCLGQRLARVEQFVVEVKELDGPALQRVRRAADELPALEDCDDAAALARVEGVMDEATRAKVDAVQRVLARVETKLELGRYQDALELAQEALERAKASGNVRVEARAWLLLGRAQGDLRQLDEAEVSLREALRRADVAHDDTTRVRAWIWLLRWVGYTKRDFETADVLAADARAALERLGDAPLLWAEFYSNLGSIASARNDLDAAADYHAKALETRISELGERSVLVAVSRNNLGNALYMKGEFEAAEQLAREAMAVFEEVLGEWHPYTETAANNLGTRFAELAERTQGETSDEHFRKAEALFRKAIEINERRVGKDHPSAEKRVHNLAQVLLRTGRNEEARREFDRTIRLKRAALPEGHVRIAAALLGRGQASFALGQVARARLDLEAALKIYEASQDNAGDEGRAECLFALAQVLRAAGEEPEAKERARGARELYASAGAQHRHHVTQIDAWLEQRDDDAKAPMPTLQGEGGP